MVRELTNAAEFEEAIKSGGAVVDFYANWCGPCKHIAPSFAQLATENPNVKFLKINVDHPWAKGIMSTHGVKCMPTFLAFKDGKQVNKLEGANLESLKAMIAGV